MANIAEVLGRLTPEEVDELRGLGPQGHLPRHLVDALDRAAGERVQAAAITWQTAM